nr:hypothetical protein [uncultured Carboxylicivirga sp.]
MIEKGLKFKSKWFDGIVEVDLVNEEDNDLEVYITSPSGSRWPEHWNLQHTLTGFKQGDYFRDKECYD